MAGPPYAWSSRSEVLRLAPNGQQCLYQLPWINQGNPYFVSWNYCNNFTDTASRSGYNNPGYARRVAKGEFIFPSPASLELVQSERGVAMFDYSPGPGQRYAVNGNLCFSTGLTVIVGGKNIALSSTLGSPTYSASLDSVMQQKAMERAFKKGSGSGFQGLVFTGELRESVQMISNRSSQLASSIEDAYSKQVLGRKPWFDPLVRHRRGQKHLSARDLSRFLKDKTGYWLENCYGWMPLLSDIKAGAEAAAAYATRKATPTSSSRSFGTDRIDNVYTGYAGSQGWGPVSADRNVTRTERTEAKFGFHESLLAYGDTGTLAQAANHFNAGWSDIAPAIWELIPYSFVVDSFTNVGDIIGALCNSHRPNAYGGWYVSFHSSEVRVDFKCPGGGSSSPQKAKVVRFSRGPRSLGYNPSLSFHLPNAGSAVNLAALALNKVSGVVGRLSSLF